MLRQLPIFFLLFVHSQLFSQNWEKLSGPYGATVERVVSNGSVTAISVKDRGLFYSTNNGDTWTPTMIRKKVYSLMVENTTFVAFTDDSLFYSSDNCQTFNKKPKVLEGSCGYMKNGVIYSSGYWSGHKVSYDMGTSWHPLSFNFCYLQITDSAWYSNYKSFSVSRDNGITWTQDFTFTSPAQSIATYSNHVWAATADKVFHSNDYARTWTVQYTTPSSYYLTIKYDRDTLYLSNKSEILRSTDLGVTWQTLPAIQPALANYHTDFCVANGTLYKVGDGVHRSTDKIHWVSANKGLNYKTIQKLTAEGNLLIYNTWGEMGYSKDNGVTWEVCKDVDSSFNGWKDFSIHNGSLIAVDCHEGIYSSQDTGKSWTYVGLPNSFWVGGVHLKPPYIYAGNMNFTENIEISANGGASWTSYQFGTFSGSGYIGQVITSSPKALIYGRINVYRSRNNGLTWTNTNLPTAQHNGIIYSGNNFYCASHNGVFIADDSAEVWTNTSPRPFFGDPHIAVYNSEIFASAGDTLFYSPNNGQFWTKINKPGFKITQVAIIPPYLYAGTQEHSIWRLYVPLMDVGFRENNLRSFTTKVSPNPITDEGVLEFNDGVIRKGVIKIYSVTGKETAKYHFDDNKVRISKTNFDSGLYIYKIQEENGNFCTGKILIK
jgi:hypothetical protein